MHIKANDFPPLIPIVTRLRLVVPFNYAALNRISREIYRETQVEWDV